MKKTYKNESKVSWILPGLILFIVFATSVSKLAGTTLGGLLGIEQYIAATALYDLAKMYRSNPSLVHILAIFFLIAWAFQGIFTFIMKDRQYSLFFIGVNFLILCPVWMYSFWEFGNVLILIIPILIALLLGLSWQLYPWHESLYQKILENVDEASGIVEKAKNRVQERANEILHVLAINEMDNVPNSFSTQANIFKNLCKNLLNELKDTRNDAKRTSNISELEHLHINSIMCLKTAHAIENDDILLKCGGEWQNVISDLLADGIKPVKSKLKYLYDKYELSHLPPHLSDIPFGNSTIHVKDIIDKNALENLNIHTNGESKIKDMFEVCNLILNHVSKIEEYIDTRMATLDNCYAHISRKVDELKINIEQLDNRKLRDKVFKIYIEPIENNIDATCTKVKSAELLFDEIENDYRIICNALDDVYEGVDFIHTLVTMAENKVPFSSLDLTDKEHDLISKLNHILKVEYGQEYSSILNDNSVAKHQEVAVVANKTDYSNFAGDIQAIINLLDDKINRKSNTAIFEIYYDLLEDAAEAFCHFIDINFKDEIICQTKNGIINIDFRTMSPTMAISKMVEKLERI